MTDAASGIDKLRAFLVLGATAGTIAFNWLAAAGFVNGVTPSEISDKYPTSVTPAGYAFTIWSLIYLGMIAFSIYQLTSANIVRFRGIRSLYIMTCALNCGWIYFWHHDQIAVSLVVILGLLAVLFLMVSKSREFISSADALFVKLPFGIYCGWVTAAALVNLAVLLVYLKVDLGSFAAIFPAVLILAAAALAVFARVRFNNYFYPLAIAWALTAIAVKQSGQTLTVAAAALGVIACLIASLSFVMKMKSSLNEQR